MKYKKKFLIIGTWNAVSYRDIFKLIRENKIWIGINSNRDFSGFIVPRDYSSPGEETYIDDDGNKVIFTGHNCWFTNMDNKKRHEDLILYKKYNKEDHAKYDNYNAINVNFVKDIPVNYNGEIGVPISFMNKYNPDQFEILGMASSAGYNKEIVGIPFIGKKDARPLINGKNTYARIIIKHKRKTK